MAGYAQVWPDTLRLAGYARAYSATSKIERVSVYGHSKGAGYAQVEPDTLRLQPDTLRRRPDTLM